MMLAAVTYNLQLLLSVALALFVSSVHASECTGKFPQTDWLKQYTYNQTLYIPSKSDPCKGIRLYWKILDNDMIQMSAVAQASGWLAFGFSETGGMRGADIVYFTHASGQVTDAYVKDGYVKPSIDDQQDWTLLNHDLVDGHLMFEVTRKLDTQDPFDRKFVDDSDLHFPDHNFLGSFGDSSDISYHGSNVVQTKIQLFNKEGDDSISGSGSGYDVFLDQMAARSENFVDLTDTYFDIPKASTWYETFCFPSPLSSDIPETAYIVGYEWIIPPSLEKYIHHIVLESRVANNDECEASPAFDAYTLGNKFFAFPEDTAIILSDAASLYGFNLQYHFDNRDGDDVINMNSGIRFYYTSVPVTHEIGSFWSGDPNVLKYGDKVGDGYTVHKFDCRSSCTKFAFDDPDITVIDEKYHMHGKGKRASNRIVRDGEVIRETAIDYWDFDQTGVAAVQRESFKLKKGDVVSTSCYFDTNAGDIFGLATEDEMCMTVFIYYPKQPNFFMCGPGIGVCSTTYDSAQLTSEEDLGRSFGYQDDGSTKNPFDTSTAATSVYPNHLLIALWVSLLAIQQLQF